MADDTQTPWLDAKAAALYVGKSQRWLREMVAQRKVPMYRVGRSPRFRREDLDAFIEAGRVGAASR